MIAGTFVALAALAAACGAELPNGCEVVATVAAGKLCGLLNKTENGGLYASFRGVPYAKQPLRELRFQELEPSEPWEGYLDAREEGPVCHQLDVIYGRLTRPREYNEACILANIYAPYQNNHALIQNRASYSLNRRFASSNKASEDEDTPKPRSGFPVLVFVHGGAFQSGSGDSDLHGPEYLVAKGVVVVTFNYRINALGFLSLNSREIPGNQGLRDQLTLLRWVRDNIRVFGGDPNNVTIMGQSAGATSVHLLTLSEASKNLFQRAIIMSGTAISGFYSSSPLLAQQLSTTFLSILGINSTAPAADIHNQLVKIPIEKIDDANAIMLDQLGLTTFLPTVESKFPGVTQVLDDDPEVLVAKGRGKDVPLIIGFTNVECEVFRRRFEEIDIVSKIIENPVLTVPANIIFTTPPELLSDVAKEVDQKYYNGSIDINGFIEYCTEGYYQYPALKLAEIRAASGGEPVFLYRFSYNADFSILKDTLNLSYTGAAHIEDLTYVFRGNYALETLHSCSPNDTMSERDLSVVDKMTSFVTDFMKCSKPVCGDESSWPAVKAERLQLQEIQLPTSHRDFSEKERDIVSFFDGLRQKPQNLNLIRRLRQNQPQESLAT